MIDIAVATCEAFPDLGPYDRALIDALARLGLSAAPMVWTDPTADWTAARAVVVQSTWDSHIDPDRFLAWARNVERTRPLLNPARTLGWNLHKSYLRQLAERGVPVTPTEWRRRGERLDLAGLFAATGWTAAVIKPAVSASAHETHIVAADAASAGQPIADRLTEGHDILVQPYLRAFESEGERSYIFFDGAFSHAVRRPPTLASAARGFDEPSRFDPDAGERRLAEAVVAALDETPVYARVDLATGNDGTVRLQELELVEPCLFTSLAAGAADRFARAIAGRL